jgi:hypothetical protein
MIIASALRLVPVVLLTLGCTASLHADEFRIESRVFQGKDEQPQSESTTIFANGRIYDFLNSPRELTIYDPAHDRIVVMDLERNRKTELRTEQLTRFREELQLRAEKTTDAGMRFLLQPKFDKQVGSTAAERVFQSEYITYQVETFTPRSATIVEQYRQFSDLSATLNAMLNRGWPPFARLQVNAALAEEKLIPTKVNLLFPSKSLLGQRKHFRSEHELHTRVTDSDQQKIAQAEEHLNRTLLVSLREFTTR